MSQRVLTIIRRRGLAWRLTERFLAGIPDILWLVDGRVGWIETKALERLTGNLGLTDAQRITLWEWGRKGGRAVVLATEGETYLVVPGEALVPAVDVSRAIYRGTSLDVALDVILGP